MGIVNLKAAIYKEQYSKERRKLKNYNKPFYQRSKPQKEVRRYEKCTVQGNSDSKSID